ncbi:hypothetical protein EV175_005761 [Coemansia sp. RSA 1933]|nr:hypothetical protein EV175_005761 [Coemansia sp. RSA 1933]
MGIFNGDLDKLARSMNKRLIRASGLTEQTLEILYENIMLVYIYPVTTNRYDIQNEADIGNGRTDILFVPSYGSTSPPDSSYYYIFELEHYQGPNSRTNEVRMSIPNRRRVVSLAFSQVMEA